MNTLFETNVIELIDEIQQKLNLLKSILPKEINENKINKNKFLNLKYNTKQLYSIVFEKHGTNYVDRKDEWLREQAYICRVNAIEDWLVSLEKKGLAIIEKENLGTDRRTKFLRFKLIK